MLGAQAEAMTPVEALVQPPPLPSPSLPRGLFHPQAIGQHAFPQPPETALREWPPDTS